MPKGCPECYEKDGKKTPMRKRMMNEVMPKKPAPAKKKPGKGPKK